MRYLFVIAGQLLVVALGRLLQPLVLGRLPHGSGRHLDRKPLPLSLSRTPPSSPPAGGLHKQPELLMTTPAGSGSRREEKDVGLRFLSPRPSGRQRQIKSCRINIRGGDATSDVDPELLLLLQ